MALELLHQCTLFVDDSSDLVCFGRVGLNSNEASVLVAKKIIPTRFLIMSRSERLISVEAIGKLRANRSVNELFVFVFDSSQAIMNMNCQRGLHS